MGQKHIVCTRQDWDKRIGCVLLTAIQRYCKGKGIGQI